MYNFLVTNEEKESPDVICVSQNDRLTKVLSQIGQGQNVSTNCLNEAFYLFLSDIDRSISTAHSIQLKNAKFQISVISNSDDLPDEYTVEMVDNVISTVCHYNDIKFKIHHDF